jgi:sulfatase modifying factor 1
MKTKLHSLFIVLALLSGAHRVAAQFPAGPTNVLSISIVVGGAQTLIGWPVSTTNYVLQTVTNLASTNWVTARTAAGVNAAAASTATPSGFFRLMPTTTPAGMALIPAGWFTMGDTLDGESDATPTNVYVSAFVMDVNLVNYGLWTNVYMYAISHGYNFVGAGVNGGTGTNYPVETVDWFDCVKWSNARSQQAGLNPVYYTDAGFTHVFSNGDNYIPVYQNLAANGYRLPTEAEWEKAARGGGIGRRFPWGDLIHTNQAQYTSTPKYYSYDLGPTNSPSGPSPVGSFDVNGYGLYDMAGNLAEWCWDWYGTPYGQPGTINPTGVGPLSGSRVLRGGSWIGEVADRCAFRFYVEPDYRSFFCGFRCVRGL